VALSELRTAWSLSACCLMELRVEDSREREAPYTDSSCVVRGEGRCAYSGFTLHVSRCVTCEPDMIGVVIETVGCPLSAPPDLV